MYGEMYRIYLFNMGSVLHVACPKYAKTATLKISIMATGSKKPQNIGFV